MQQSAIQILGVSIQDNVNFNNCYIDLTGDFSIQTAATVSQPNQIVSAAQNTTLQMILCKRCYRGHQ